MTTWIKLLKYWKAALVGLVIGYILFLNVRLWYKGLDLGATSVYSYKPAPYFAEHTKRWKKARVETFPCVKVQGIRVPSDSTNTASLSQKVPTDPSYSLGAIELGEWQLKRLPYGGVAQAQLDTTGLTHLVVTQHAPKFLELGRSRSLGLSASYSLLSEDHPVSFEIYLRQDLVRVGPVWIQGGVSAGQGGASNDLDLSVQLNAELRF